MNVDTSRELSTRVLRALTEGPKTVEQLMTALDLPATERGKIESTVRNHRNRGRLTATRLEGVSGRPSVYAVKPETAVALEVTPFGERPWRQSGRKPGKGGRPPRPPRPRQILPADVRRWSGYFLRAGWSKSTTARLFGVAARDLEGV